MKKIIFLTFSLIFGFVLFFITLKQVGLENIISAISVLSFWQILFILGIFILNLLIGALRWKIVLKAQYPFRISFYDILIAKTVGHSINYLTPIIFAGGEPFKALVLKGRVKIPLDKAAISIVIEEVIFLSVSFLFVVLGMFFFFVRFTISPIFGFLLFGIILFCLIMLYLFYSRTIRKAPDGKGFFTFFIEIFHLDRVGIINGIKTKVSEAEKEISYFFRHRQAKLVEVSFLAVVEILLLLLTYWLIVIFLGQKLNFGEIISINALIHLISFIPIPAALGSFEWSQAFIFYLFGLGSNTGIAFSLIVRCVTLIIAGLGIFLLIHFEIKALAKKTGETLQKIIATLKKLSSSNY